MISEGLFELGLLFTEDREHPAGATTCAETGVTGFEMENKTHLNGNARQTFLAKPSSDYAPGAVSIAVSESTHLNSKQEFHTKDISQY